MLSCPLPVQFEDRPGLVRSLRRWDLVALTINAVIGAGSMGSVWAAVISHLTFILPLVTWFLIGFFDEVPRELEEAAKLRFGRIAAIGSQVQRLHDRPIG